MASICWLFIGALAGVDICILIGIFGLAEGISEFLRYIYQKSKNSILGALFNTLTGIGLLSFIPHWYFMFVMGIVSLVWALIYYLRSRKEKQKIFIFSTLLLVIMSVLF